MSAHCIAFHKFCTGAWGACYPSCVDLQLPPTFHFRSLSSCPQATQKTKPHAIQTDPHAIISHYNICPSAPAPSGSLHCGPSIMGAWNPQPSSVYKARKSLVVLMFHRVRVEFLCTRLQVLSRLLGPKTRRCRAQRAHYQISPVASWQCCSTLQQVARAKYSLSHPLNNKTAGL